MKKLNRIADRQKRHVERLRETLETLKAERMAIKNGNAAEAIRKDVEDTIRELRATFEDPVDKCDPSGHRPSTMDKSQERHTPTDNRSTGSEHDSNVDGRRASADIPSSSDLPAHTVQTAREVCLNFVLVIIYFRTLR